VSEINDTIGAQEAAALLRSHVETVRRLARRGAIPAFKVGKDWRFSRESIKRWAGQRSRNVRFDPVLVVDDDPAFSRLLSRVIQKLGYPVLQAGGGRDALKEIARETPGLVLLDLLMPEMTGAEFLKRLRPKHPALPVAIITGHPESELLYEAMKYGPLIVLAKPFDVDQLSSLLRIVLGRRIGADL
jgi:excisionase family DNA binding protein